MPARKTNVEEETTEKEVVIKAEKLPDNLYIPKSGTRLLYHSGRLPTSKVQDYLTRIFLNTNLDASGMVKDDSSTEEQLKTVKLFMDFIKSLVTWRIFTLYDGLPEDDDWLIPFQLAPMEDETLPKNFDFRNKKHLEILYIQNHVLSAEDLEEIIELING